MVYTQSSSREVKEADLEVITSAGVESFAGGLGVLIERLAGDNPEAYEKIVKVAAETCEAEQYRDSPDHLNIIARKKDA